MYYYSFAATGLRDARSQKFPTTCHGLPSSGRPLTRAAKSIEASLRTRKLRDHEGLTVKFTMK